MIIPYSYANGDFYQIQYRWRWFKVDRNHRDPHLLICCYEMYLLFHPPCSYAMGLAAHLYPGDLICVLHGREPRTLERAKAIALVWMHGFSCYRRTGVFPNGSARVDVAEVS